MGKAKAAFFRGPVYQKAQTIGTGPGPAPIRSLPVSPGITDDENSVFLRPETRLRSGDSMRQREQTDAFHMLGL